MDIWKVGAIGAAAGLGVAVVAKRFAGSGRSKGEGSRSLHTAGRDELEAICRRGGLDERQILFLSFVARGESGFNTLSGRGDPEMRPPGLTYFDTALGESVGARTVYERNEELFEGCGHEDGEYVFGSGGLFAFLPTVALYQLRRTPLVCASPYEIFDPAFSVTAAYAFAQSIKRHKGHRGTVESMRAGWGSFRRMSNPASYSHKIPKWKMHLEDLGVSPSYLSSPSPSFPERDLTVLYRSMGGDYGLA